MAFGAGNFLTAAQLNRIQPVTYTATQSGNAGSQYTLTTTATDLLAATVTFSTTTANAVFVVNAFFDFEVTAAGTSVLIGQLVTDGNLQAGEAHSDGSTVQRHTVGQTWRGTLAASGSHTFKLRGLKTAAVGTMVTNDSHTRLTIQIAEVPA